RAVEMPAAGGQREEVQVWIDQPREERSAAAVHAASRAAGDAPDVRTAADRKHSAITYRDGGRPRDGRVERHDPRVRANTGGVRQSEDGSGFASFSFMS